MTDRLFIVPEWKGSVYEKWAYNVCRQNQWRLAHAIGDIDDLMSECALYFLKVKKQYGGTVKSPKHLMYLYQLWVRAEFNTRSVRDYKARHCLETMLKNKPLTVQSDAELNAAINESSSELKEMLHIFISAPQEVLGVIRADANSSKQYFKSVARFCGISIGRAKELAVELRSILVR